MKYTLLAMSVLGASLFLNINANGQTEDCRNLSGLPIPIGQPVMCGQVKIRGRRDRDPMPQINVTLLVGGVQVERMRTNESGYYYFLRSPSNNAALVFEVNNVEVGRVALLEGVGSNVRRDVEVDITEIANAPTATAAGVVAAPGGYTRGAEAEKEFQNATAAAKAGRSDQARELLKGIVARDPKDFVAWTELGTVEFRASRNDDADKAYKRALELKPDFLPALMNQGKLYLAQKSFDKAADSFYKAVAANSQYADAFHYLGEAYLQLKQGSKAVLALNEAIRLAPEQKAELHLRLATLYHGAGAKDRAANEYKLFLQKVPNHADRQALEKYIKDNAKP